MFDFPERPRFAQAGINSEVTIATKIVSLTRFSGIGQANRISFADDSIVDRRDVVEDLRFAILIKVFRRSTTSPMLASVVFNISAEVVAVTVCFSPPT